MIPAACVPASSPIPKGSERDGKQEKEPGMCCPKCGQEIQLTTIPAKISEQLTPSELKEKIIRKEERISHLQKQLALSKQSLQVLVERKNALADLWGKVLTSRSRVHLTRKAYEDKKASNRKELEELQMLEKNNSRRNERLNRVRNKDFTKKERALSDGILMDQRVANQRISELVAVRRDFITRLYHRVFLIEVLPLSDEDAGAEDYHHRAKIDCDHSLDLEGGWVLGGVHSHPSPHISIVAPSLPANGDHTSYLKALTKRTNNKGVQEASLHPINDPLTSTPAALVYIAQFVELIAFVLDQPLPFPLPSRPVAISEYGVSMKRKRLFLTSMAKLDDNIMYLCFSQNVPQSALAPGHTLQNLLALVTHTELGRNEAFECCPELMCYKKTGLVRESPMLSQDMEDNQPPNVSYTADTPTHETDTEGEEEEEEELGDREARGITSGHNNMEWEHLYPNIEEMQLFEEEQMRIKLKMEPTSLDRQKQAHKQAQEADLRRQKLRRLDYDSTYMDYATLMGTLAPSSSTTSSSSAQLSVVENGSIEEDAGGEVKERGDGSPRPGTESKEMASAGLFGTLSSLWTSAFGRSSS